MSPIFGFGLGAARDPSGGLLPPLLLGGSGGRPSGLWLNSVSDMRESPPRVLCRVAIGPGLAHRERLEPSAIAFDPLMRSTGPSGCRGGTQGRYQVTRADATRVRSQFRPEMTVRAGQSKCPDGRTDVVFGLTTLPLPPDREHGSSEHLFHPLLQLLIRHSEHLQLPVTRCYLLLERTLRFSDEGSCLDADPLGQECAQGSGQVGQGDLLRRGRFEAQVEVFAEGLAPHGQSQAKADERVGRNPCE